MKLHHVKGGGVSVCVMLADVLQDLAHATPMRFSFTIFFSHHAKLICGCLSTCAREEGAQMFRYGFGKKKKKTTFTHNFINSLINEARQFEISIRRN